MFIHDALNDYLTCGDTSVPAHELRRTISALAGRDGEGRSGFERQFEAGYAKTILFCSPSRNDSDYVLCVKHCIVCC